MNSFNLIWLRVKKFQFQGWFKKNIVKLSINEELNEEENQNLIAQFWEWKINFQQVIYFN
jgi:hypothetical protein